MLNEIMIDAVLSAIGTCAKKSQWSIVAASIEPTHTHLLISYSGRDIHTTAKWIADQTTKAVHRTTQHQGPVWAKGKWCSYVFDESRWRN
ncbi:MAG: transposase, partial [Alphaproteobacteria bacterium]|nr:transposase [Alphaproteobacteria bacterium]